MPISSDLLVCAGKIILCSIMKSNPRSKSVPTIQTVKGRVVFFHKGSEKISTLKPLTVWIFAVVISPPKTASNRPQARFVPLFPSCLPATLKSFASITQKSGYANNCHVYFMANINIAKRQQNTMEKEESVGNGAGYGGMEKDGGNLYGVEK